MIGGAKLWMHPKGLSSGIELVSYLVLVYVRHSFCLQEASRVSVIVSTSRCMRQQRLVGFLRKNVPKTDCVELIGRYIICDS